MSKYKPLIFVLAISVNILLLIYYKYLNFLLTLCNDAFTLKIPLYEGLNLPLGISFFTFTQIAFLVDVFKNKVKKCHLGDYSVLITFFPHLIAGPILHHKQIIPQVKKLKLDRVIIKRIWLGIVYFVVGLSKKVLIADDFGSIATQYYDQVMPTTCAEAWIASLAYTLQIYFDFSGYSDMAMGLAYMLQIKIPQNFNAPYMATNIQEFWRRWHITLSKFLRVYIYIPLGGNRVPLLHNCLNLCITFLLGGLWHGANLTFVVWGLIHGLGLVLHRFWNEKQNLLPFIKRQFINVDRVEHSGSSS